MSPQEQGRPTRLGRPSSIREIKSPQRYAGVDNHELAAFNLSGDRSPFGPPPELPAILEDIFSSGDLIKALEIYGFVSDGPTIDNIREHFGISDRPEIVTTTDGTDNMIDSFMKLAHNKKSDKPTRILGVGMLFPVIVESINNAGPHISYVPTRASISTPIEGYYEKVKDYIKRSSRNTHNLIVYDNFPTTPKGEVVDPEIRREFYLYCRDKGILVITDEAFAGYVTTEESAIKMVDEVDQNTGELVFNNLAVTRTWSKGDGGIPGARLGALIASPDVGKEYRKLKMPYPNGFEQMLFNRVSDTRIMTPHAERIREKTIKIKPKMVALFRSHGYEVYPTDDRTPIFLIDGKTSELYRRLKSLGVDVTPAGAFGVTFYDSGHDTTNRFLRVTIPGDEEKLETIVEKFAEASDIIHPGLRTRNFRPTA